MLTRSTVQVFVVVACTFLGGSTARTAAQKPLTNDDVVIMVQAGLPQDVVVDHPIRAGARVTGRAQFLSCSGSLSIHPVSPRFSFIHLALAGA